MRYLYKVSIILFSNRNKGKPTSKSEQSIVDCLWFYYYNVLVYVIGQTSHLDKSLCIVHIGISKA